MALTLKKQGDDTKASAKEPIEKSRKKYKFLSGTRFVFFIGDEGTILLHIKNNIVLSRQFVPDGSEQNLEELRLSLNKDPKAPVSMVIDSMDQSFTQQTLPPVSSMSVKKLITRRLERDFAPKDIKGAILLGREETGRKDWNFMMVSIERSRLISIWLDFILSLPNLFQGIYLVSVEAEILLRKLDNAMGVPKAGTGAKWKFFVSHNKVGGFRQVILRNGHIIFTRMSQPIGESTPEVIAGNIEQEIQSTIEYMKRLTYNTQAGLDIYVIASDSVRALIDKSKFVTTTFNVFTPYEVAQHLGIQGATQPTDQFGDVILAASIATSPKHVLKLTTPEARRLDGIYNAFRLQRGIAALLIVGILLYAASIASDIYLKYQDSEDLELTKRAHQRNLDALREEIKNSHLDVDNLGDIMELYQALLKQTVMPFAFLTKVQAVLKSPIVIKGIDWTTEDKAATPATAGMLTPAKATIVFTLQFPGVADAATFKAVSKRLLDDMKAIIPGYEIAFGKLPAKYTEAENLSMSFDNQPAPAAVSNDVPDVILTFKEL